MKEPRAVFSNPWYVVLTLLLVLFAASIAVNVVRIGSLTKERSARTREKPPKAKVWSNDPSPSEKTVSIMEKGTDSSVPNRGLFVGELRVIAIGSAYPIPYDAEICPYTAIPQPRLNQLDRDGDGMTDDWEIKYGLNPYDASDARDDLDKDGFTNEEEFSVKADPSDASSHPPHALKLRFVKIMDIPFPLVFQGSSTLSDNQTVFQVNTPADGRTHFLSLGESLMDITLERHIPGDTSAQDHLIVRRGNSEIDLPRGRKITDPESKAELINILDHRREVVTMGMLLSVNNEEYTVIGVYHDRAEVRLSRTGEVFDIERLNELEREALLRESE